MADGINMGNMSPEDYAQQQALTRQQQMAQLLMQQGTQQPQGQMVSGRYVPTSFFQNLVPLANIAASQYVGGKADAEQAKLAQRLRAQEMSDIQKYSDLYKGKAGVAEVPEKTTELAGPYTGDIAKPVAYQAPVAGQAPIEANPEAANLFAASSYSPILRQMGIKKITEGPQWKEVSQYNQKTGNTETYLIDTNSAQPENTKRFVGVSKPEMTASERAHLGIAYANAADQGIPGYGGNPRASQPTVNQGSPVLAKPPTSLAPNAPSYAQSAISMPQANNGYTLVQDFNKSIVPPVGLSPKAQREWNTEANKPLTGEPAKQVTGAINTIGAIDNYSKILSDYSKLSSLSPEQRANLSSAYNTMILQSKEANALGVLNGQDYEILKSLAPNPNDIKNLLVSNDVLRQQATKQRDFMGNVVVNAYGIHQKKIPEFVASKIKPIAEEITPAKADKITRPSTVDENTWNFMTPQQKALFK